MTNLRIPSSTYRLQFNSEFSLHEARDLVPYLHDLGVTDLYASPLLQARQGSGYGYDVVDPTRLNRELGGEEAFAGLTEALRQRDMGLLLDIVPNHMAASAENRWWADVLRHGPDSPYAGYFDIDWQPGRPGLAGKVLLPIIASPYGEALENGELVLALAEDGFRVHYRGNPVPVRPDSYRDILGLGPAGTGGQPDPDPVPQQLEELLAALDKLPPRHDTGYPAAFREITGRLWQLYQTNSATRLLIDKSLQAINGIKGEPGSFTRLDKLLAGQHYLLAFWRPANREINYRRFFSISELVSVHAEDQHVFEATHDLVLRLCKAGLVTGLRIDHIDGLYDPEAYLGRLQERLTETGEHPGFYVVAEKILGHKKRGHTSDLGSELGGRGMSPTNEALPVSWPVYGTSGYDFLNLVNGLFVHGAGLTELGSIYRRHGAPEDSFQKMVYQLKKRAIARLFNSETRTLAEQLGRLAEQDRHGRDLALDQLEEAVVEVIACFPVYRTYLRDLTLTDRDREYIEKAVALVHRRNPGAERACEFLRRVLLLEFTPDQTQDQQQDWLHFVMRWQQFTGPVMAKGVEDSAMYVYNRLVSLNEVGGKPDAPPVSVAAFHRRNRAGLQRLPHSMNATSTHDTKRSEDVRARINVLSEIPTLWAGRLEQWRQWNNRHKSVWNSRPVPGGNMEQLIYQTLVGAWPLRENEVPGFKKRLADYLVKAAREAGRYTNWQQPDEDYEKALVQFAMSILDPGGDNPFRQDFIRFQATTAYYGALGSLAQVLLKITSPGVPDFYRGTELWDFSLVDPDNRRPVDFSARAAMLAQLREREAGGRAALTALARELLESWREGRVKLFLTYRALHYRRNHPGLFTGGEYIPVEAAGPGAGHICAFARRTGESWALVVVPRLLALFRTGNGGRGGTGKPAGAPPPLDPPLGEQVWGGHLLLLPDEAPGMWRNILTGENLTAEPAGPEADAPPGSKVLPLAAVWQSFPVALLAGA
ncbi:maltooligosyl trehalose synthase [Desulfotomaculum arcticum]|uniref:Maltooligosyl trehalose synthase n=1 Tax=Desulfotruncus arcticus DSM 17038 TaxID=1121424 RepID=A0A1I2WCS8_9FIRM|nr:malto-oligosyltrehalose synthase [Desulfotruncus arcticus]SFG97986.1 maltooligosyl trehalose synthase [Desulfotomaculum arcticum] [Desulfotruncus arcticus DSM 17038]